MTRLRPEEQAKRRDEVVHYLRTMAHRQIRLATEFLEQADRLDDAERADADRGHTFRFSVALRGSTIVTGDAHHRDAEDFELIPNAVEVRAWDLPAALAIAAALPLAVWYPEGDEG